MHLTGRACLIFIFGVALGLVSANHAPAQQLSDARIADLVQAGKLRAGMGVVAPHHAVKDRQTGELRGVAVEVGRALAARMGIAFAAIEYPSPTIILDGLKTQAWDVGFTAIDPSRATTVDFTPPHMQVDNTYLVPANSPVGDIAAADRPSLRIGVGRNSIIDIVLSRTLKQAEIVRFDVQSAAVEALRASNVDVLALPRPAALQWAARLPETRVLDGRFHTTYEAIMVPKGHPGRLAYVSAFVEEAKTSGLVQRAIERAGARGVQVAPPGYPP
jgi:polar amino acid transport system substrate-binding protein